MESSSSHAELDDEEKALKSLLDAFGSTFSLEDIASAFCKAGGNAPLAGEMLYDMQSCNFSSTTHASDGDAKSDISSEWSCTTGSDGSYHTNGDANPKASKLKQRPASMGTISSVLGKTYLGSTPFASGTGEETKPLRLESSKLTTLASSGSCSAVKDASREKDFENFLFEMLGEGFQLDRDVIREVLGHCGYDMEKSLEELLDRTAKSYDRRDNVHEGVIKHSKSANSQYCHGGNVIRTNGSQIPNQRDKRHQQEKEILTALFSVPERPKEREWPRKIQRQRRSRAFESVVAEPIRDAFEEHEAKTVSVQESNMGAGEEEDAYTDLRKAVEEYRAAMKEYYKAAAEAFAKGERGRARTLLEQGQFFHERARQTDEESANKIFVIRGKDWDTPEETTLSLDLRSHDAKGALHLVKFHLQSFSGIPSFTHMKITTGINGEDVSKGASKRWVLKLLEKESIKWTEDGATGTILIRLDEINPKRLSFSKK
ncbi:hypothetical protein Dimus_035212 [Dionaea muscipula]